MDPSFLDDDIIAIISRYTDEVIRDEEIRAQWNLIDYNAAGLQDRMIILKAF